MSHFGPLTRHQAETLAAIVRYSKNNGDRVPKPKDLAPILGITEIAAKGRISRLKKYFVEGVTPLRVNVEQLCTISTSALFFLAVRSMSLEDKKDGRVFKSSLFEKLTCQHKDIFNNDLLENLWKKGIEAGYIINDPYESEAIRPGELLTDQLEYLKLIAS
ncbi:MAG: hypothetical protein PHY72_02055 [Candidatus Pacebacteria bacterium]|nr:hypothetical protein [Candidatus Paceibacterota bacterium]